MNKLSEWCSIIANFVVILGIPLFFYTQYAEAISAKKEHSLEFIKFFLEGDMREARSILSQPWLDIGDQIAVSNSVGGLSNSDRVRLAAIVIESDEALTDVYKKSIFKIDEFYQVSNTCIEQNICEGVYLKNFLDEYYRPFYCLFGEYIIESYKKIGASTKHIEISVSDLKSSCRSPDNR